MRFKKNGGRKSKGERMKKGEGICPKCGTKGQLEYDAVEMDEYQLYYPFHCEACGADGKEWYTLVYADSTLR